jgi:hypothetical protein
MSSRKQLAVDTNIIMDAVKADGAADVVQAELDAAREIGARLLTENIMVYSTKIEQEWTAKGLLRSNTLLLSLARFDRMKQVVARHLNHGQVRDLGEFVDRDDQPFVLVAAVIDDGSRLLITRDPKTVQVESRRYVKKEFKVVVKKASELV